MTPGTNVEDRQNVRFRFADFTLSPRRRVLLAGGRELPLIPRYFDLLVLLIERRNEAVQRREILEAVWSDVVVSDGALSQAVRILRRTLGDDSRGQTFIRTIPRHGYRFVFPDVVEEPDDEPLAETPEPRATPEPPRAAGDAEDPFQEPLTTLLTATGSGTESARRQAAETLHALGTAEALRRLDRLPGHEVARAYLREARWDIRGAGPVPLFGHPGAAKAIATLIRLRGRRVLRIGGRRWASAAIGGATLGLVAGTLGALALRFGPGSTANNSVLFALPMVGFLIGGFGATGVGGGLAFAEAVVRSFRGAALVVCGALGGGLTGSVAHLFGLLTLEGLFGQDLSPVGGGFEGLVVGGAVGLGYALSTPTTEGGMAAPRGAARVRAALVTGVVSAVATGLLAASGSHLGAMSLDFMARTYPGSQVGLDPVARLLGESAPGLLTRVVISSFEGLMFGVGVVSGLTHRPR